VFFEWKYHMSGFLGRETHETTGPDGIGIANFEVKLG
jgi:hypothetical protein